MKATAVPTVEHTASSTVLHAGKQGNTPFFSPPAGNETPFFAPRIQTKLTIGRPSDKYEQEADAVADRVVQRLANPGATIAVQKKCQDCAEKEKLQRKEEEREEPAVMRQVEDEQEEAPVQAKAEKEEEEKPGIMRQAGPEEEEPLQAKAEAGASPTTSLQSRLSATKGSGANMDKSARAPMEAAFGQDFGRVRIHTDGSSAQMNRELKARAFTHGRDIYFNAGEYSPGSTEGRRLLAHELVHVGQQGGGELSKLRPVQRAMKFEFQTQNVIWRTGGKTEKRRPLPRKFGPKDYIHKGTKGERMKKTKKGKVKEGTQIEMQTDTKGVIEFETPKWFRKWSDLKTRIQEAIEITKIINNAKDTSIGFKEFPFSIKHLKKANYLEDKETLEVQIIDKDWKAWIQSSEDLALSQYESLLREHKPQEVAEKIITKSSEILNAIKSEIKSGVNTSNLLSFIQIIVDYIDSGQAWQWKGERRDAKTRFWLMSRTSFSSIYRSLLSKDEQKLFQYIINKNIIPEKLGIETNAPFFAWAAYYSNRHLKNEEIIKIGKWLESIIKPNKKTGKDLLSPPIAGSPAMGRFEVETKKNKKDTDLVKFEVRASEGSTKRSRVQPADKWLQYAEEVFHYASICRRRPGSGTELIYDGNLKPLATKECH